MKNKIVARRDPEAITVNLDAIPDHTNDALCRTLVVGIKEIFKDPAVLADFENWREKRQQKKQGA